MSVQLRTALSIDISSPVTNAGSRVHRTTAGSVHASLSGVLRLSHPMPHMVRLLLRFVAHVTQAVAHCRGTASRFMLQPFEPGFLILRAELSFRIIIFVKERLLRIRILAGIPLCLRIFGFLTLRPFINHPGNP